jgi:hypothetical protein
MRVHRFCEVERLRLRSDGGDSGSKKCKRSCDGVYGVVWRSLHLMGVWSLESGGSRVGVGVFGRNVAEVAVEKYWRFIYFIKKCKNVLRICKDKAVLNFITFERKTKSFPSTLMGHTTLDTKPSFIHTL